MPPGAVNPQPQPNPPVGGAGPAVANPAPAVNHPVGGAGAGGKDEFLSTDPKALAKNPATAGFMATLNSIRMMYLNTVNITNYMFKAGLARFCNNLANSVVSAIQSAIASLAGVQNTQGRDALTNVLSMATDIVSQTNQNFTAMTDHEKQAQKDKAGLTQLSKAAGTG